MPDYQSMGHKIYPCFSGLSDETLNRGLVSDDLVAGRMLNPLTFCLSVST